MEMDGAPSLHDSLTDAHQSSTPKRTARAGSSQLVPPEATPETTPETAPSFTVPSSVQQTPVAIAHVASPTLQQEASNITAGLTSQDGPITAAEADDAFEQAEHGVEAAGDEGFDDGYETSDTTGSTSLATSAREFIMENGRRYHSFRMGAYLFPNDDAEQDREDLKHAMFLKLFNKQLHFAPIPDGANVIDLGTGTGIWAIDFADMYPSASVLGVDLSPIQTSWVPPNLKFMIDDVESTWLYPQNHFDFIHTRHLIQAIHNWPTLFERAFAHLKPGAWMECQELDHFPRCEDGTMGPDNWMVRYWHTVADGMLPFGVQGFRDAPRLKAMMQEAGFVNVTERVFFTPIGPWPKNRALKEVGLYWRAVLMEGLEAIALKPLIQGLGWRKEEVDVFCAKTRAAYLERGVHAYMPFFVLYGQKPGGGFPS